MHQDRAFRSGPDLYRADRASVMRVAGSVDGEALSTVNAGRLRRLGFSTDAERMFEIYIDDDGSMSLDHVLAVHHDLDAVLDEIEYIGEETAQQLTANGEGCSDFLLRLAVWDTERCEIVLRSDVPG